MPNWAALRTPGRLFSLSLLTRNSSVLISSYFRVMEPGIAPSHTNSKEQRRKQRFDQQFDVFEVEGNVYRERRYMFEKWSESTVPAVFAVLGEESAKGRLGSDENPIRLLGCTAGEFESLLEVMYSTDESAVTLDKEDWMGVLKLARLWNMPQLAVMAIDRISPDLSPMEKITMGKGSAHRVAQWLREGYADIIGDMSEATLEGLAADLGWERTARVLWAFKKACFKRHPSPSLRTADVVEEIVEEELGKDDSDIEAGLRSTYLTAIPNLLRITVTQDQPVPRRAGTASIISFAPDGVYVSRDLTQAPTRVLQDFGCDAGWLAEKHVRLVGDTTGCGRSDIIGFGDTGVSVSRNNGDGTFTPAKVILNDFGYDNGWRTDKHLRYVVDLRKRGFVDIIGFGDAGVYVALNKGNGTFIAPKIVLPDFGYDVGGWRLERHLRFLADVTGNGLPDIIGFGETGVSVALNNGDGTFQRSKVAIQDFSPGAGGWSIEKHPRTVADLTGDGRVDIIGFFDDGVRIALNAGNGTFRPAKLVVGAFGYSASGWRVGEHPRFVADITGNGRGDIVGFPGSLHISMNKDDGTFTVPGYILSGFDQSDAHPIGEFLWLPVDLTGTGAADIIGFGKDFIWVSYNDGKGKFGTLQKLRASSPGDVNKTVHWVTNLYA